MTTDANGMALSIVQDARAQIEQVKDIFQAKEFIAITSAAVAFYAAQGLEESAQAAREASLWAQRKAGEFLQQMDKHPGGRPTDKTGSNVDPVLSGYPRLADLDIDKHESFRWQLLAELPQDEFQAYIDDKLGKGYELTTGGLIRLALERRGVASFSGAVKEAGGYYDAGEMNAVPKFLAELVVELGWMEDLHWVNEQWGSRLSVQERAQILSIIHKYF